MYYVINPSGVDSSPATLYAVRVYAFRGAPLLAERTFATYAEAVAWRFVAVSAAA